MSRNRDIANVLSKSTPIALDSEVGLVPVTPSSIAVTGGSGSISLNTVSFTSASAVSLNDVFSSTYDNYKILIKGGTGATELLILRLRVGGSDFSGSDYRRSQIGRTYAGATDTDQSASGTAFGAGRSETSQFTSDLIIFSPFLSENTRLTGIGQDASRGLTHTGFLSNTNSYTGFTFFGTSMTGTIQVYGYRK